MSNKVRVVIELEMEIVPNEGCQEPQTDVLRQAVHQIFLKRPLSGMSADRSFACMGFKMVMDGLDLDVQNTGNGAEF